MIKGLLLSENIKDAFNVSRVKHNNAMRHPRGVEIPIIYMIKGFLGYGIHYQDRYKDSVGSDGYIGPCFENLGRTIIALLNGHIGRLDANTIDSFIRLKLKESGCGYE